MRTPWGSWAFFLPMAREGESLLTLREVTKSYGGVRVLGPVTLDVRPGEILGVRGRNGAGKSTLLALMAGVLRPDSGVRTAAPGLEVSYLPQETTLYGELTGLENLRFWGIAQGLDRNARRARSRWLLENLGLADAGTKRVLAYSGGMRRRLDLATALMGTPDLLLLDEPTAGADGESAALMLRLIEHFRDRGVGVVLISHRAGELESVSDRTLTLEQGLVVG